MMLQKRSRAIGWISALALGAQLALGCGSDDRAAASGSAAAQVAGAAGGRAPAGTGGTPSADAGRVGAAAAGNASGGASAAGQGGLGSAASMQSADSARAISALKAYLAQARDARPELAKQAFAALALTKADAQSARKLLWDDFAANVRQTRAAEAGATEKTAKSFELDGHQLRYYMAVRGDKPASGRSLIISMHGGGQATSDVNDSQWDNQIALVEGYKPKDAVWVAPRAPSDAWNMWFTDDIDALFEHLITSMIVFEGIDPNKVYINGYSAGGDGVYQLGPRMADHWAGAGMSAGHPNTASPLNLRNLAFAIHVGAQDADYDRNKKAQEWGKLLETLAAGDAGGYPNQWQLHEGRGHWMELEDAVGVEFMQRFTRDPVPAKVVWRQAEQTRTRMYWLAVAAKDAITGAVVRANYIAKDRTISITEATDVPRLQLRLSDAMMDLDGPVRVELAGRELFFDLAPRTIDVISRTMIERGDPAAIFDAEVSVQL